MEQQRRMKAVQQKFRMKGFTLTLDALKVAVAFVYRSGGTDTMGAMEALLGSTDGGLALRSNMLDKATVEAMVAELEGVEDPAQGRRVLQVVDAFSVPKIAFDPVGKTLYARRAPIALHGEAQAKASLYRERFLLLQQRVLKDKHFARPAFETLHKSQFGSCEITPLQSLVGCAGRRWVMGVILQVEDGRFHLEDLSALVPVDISEAKTTAGFFTENSVVLAEGELQVDGVFKVSALGFPPLERRQTSLQSASGLSLLPGAPLTMEEYVRLGKLEKQAVNDMFVVISDVWVDSEEAMAKLEVVLDGYESMEVVPSLFVFMGNFCSYPCNLASHDFVELRGQFAQLGALIASHPRIKDGSQVLLVPGPGDPGPANVLPRPALPKYFTKEILKHVPNAIFGSNPCRIRYYAQDIVLFREDLQYRMRRSCVCVPSEDETTDLFEHLVLTMLQQNHLCPLPLTTQPINWSYDHALYLYPTPDAIILGDRAAQHMVTCHGVKCSNPGSFANDGTFIVYRPATREVELCAV